MPRAVRKKLGVTDATENKPDAKPLPVEPQRRPSAVGTRQLSERLRALPASPADDATLRAKHRLPDWHGALAQLSAAVVLSYSQGWSRDGAAAGIELLRLLADDMAAFLDVTTEGVL